MQESREREGKKKVIKAKPEFCFLQAPHLHKEEIETNLMTPQNDIFACRNQSHVMYEDGRSR